MQNPGLVPAAARPALEDALRQTECPLCHAVGTLVLEDRTRPVVGALTMRTTSYTAVVCTTAGCSMAALTHRMPDDA